MRVAVAIPCFNEAATIGKVVRDFRSALPDAEVLVFDNASSDGSGERAREAGARVLQVGQRGKGFVMQRIFDTVDADICVVVDGDGTYLAGDVHGLLEPIIKGQADMVVGSRLQGASRAALDDVRRLGNLLILRLVNFLSGSAFQDVLSGFRAMSRDFLKTVSLAGGGFETETELTLRAIHEHMVIREVPIGYRERPEGSRSKLSPVVDGCRILVMIARLLGSQQPLYLFGLLALVLLAADLVYGAFWLAGGGPAAPRCSIRSRWRTICFPMSSAAGSPSSTTPSSVAIRARCSCR
ncbi:MAG: glycosyltransferase [Acidobacteriota bacterium]